jgi:carbonic anhydrase
MTATHSVVSKAVLPGRLLEGYFSFLAGRHAFERQRYRDLAKDGQAPEIMMIACCDSRAAPEMIFDAGPGELFVARNVANLMPPYAPDGEYHATSAALEYGVQVLKVRHIVVLGHGRCGGIKAALDPSAGPFSPGDFIGKWMSLLAPAAARVNALDVLTPAERQTALERASIRASVENLRTFPCVSILEGKGRLSLHGAWFDIETGELWAMDPVSGDFVRPEPPLLKTAAE